jgi:hypothetical protein
MRKPYLQLYKTIDGFDVYVVDGAYIRKNMNDQFTNFGQHYRFPSMIPTYEFWIDRENGGKRGEEAEYFIPHMKKEWELMRNGTMYPRAITEADEVEHDLRNQDESSQYKIRELEKIGDIAVWLVNGKKIRDDCYIDFTEGGHDLVYDWIPKNEIWLDDDISKEERPYILDHEYEERCRMARGMPYNHAHNEASLLERNLRHKEPHIGTLQKLNRFIRPKRKTKYVFKTHMRRRFGRNVHPTTKAMRTED